MEIRNLISILAESLKGSDARIQVQVGNKCYEQTIGNSAALSKSPIYYYLNSCKTKRISFLKWMKGAIQNANVKESTRMNHISTYKKLSEFRDDIAFDELDKRLVRDFDNYLTNSGAKKNTITKHMKVFHRYVNAALDDELLPRDPFLSYHMKYERATKEYLSEHEVCLLLHIVNTLTNPFEVSSIRGFLFSCYTGLRYSDVLRVTKRHLHSADGVTWLKLRMKKTETEVRIPISEMFGGAAMLLIDQSKADNEPQFNLPNNCVANHNIQRVLKRYGIKKHISFHCGMVTAATLMLEKNVPLTTIQHILGHSSVKITEVYAKVNEGAILKSFL